MQVQINEEGIRPELLRQGLVWIQIDIDIDIAGQAHKLDVIPPEREAFEVFQFSNGFRQAREKVVVEVQIGKLGKARNGVRHSCQAVRREIEDFQHREGNTAIFDDALGDARKEIVRERYGPEAFGQCLRQGLGRLCCGGLWFCFWLLFLLLLLFLLVRWDNRRRRSPAQCVVVGGKGFQFWQRRQDMQTSWFQFVVVDIERLEDLEVGKVGV